MWLRMITKVKKHCGYYWILYHKVLHKIVKNGLTIYKHLYNIMLCLLAQQHHQTPRDHSSQRWTHVMNILLGGWATSSISYSAYKTQQSDPYGSHQWQQSLLVLGVIHILCHTLGWGLGLEECYRIQMVTKTWQWEVGVRGSWKLVKLTWHKQMEDPCHSHGLCYRWIQQVFSKVLSEMREIEEARSHHWFLTFPPANRSLVFFNLFLLTGSVFAICMRINVHTHIFLE